MVRHVGKSYQRFELLVHALDAIYNEKRCPDVKGVRDALLQPQNICMLLLVVEVLVPINYFSKFLQTRSLQFTISARNLQFLRKEWNWHAPLHNRILVNVDEIKVKVNNFLYEIGYNFVERLLEEVNKALEEASDVLIADDVFHPDNDQRKSMLYCQEQFSVLANHYGNEIFDEYNGHTVYANCLISKNDQQAEVQYFVTEFNGTFEKLKANVLEEANRKLRLDQLKREEM